MMDGPGESDSVVTAGRMVGEDMVDDVDAGGKWLFKITFSERMGSFIVSLKRLLIIMESPELCLRLYPGNVAFIIY